MALSTYSMDVDRTGQAETEEGLLREAVFLGLCFLVSLSLTQNGLTLRRIKATQGHPSEHPEYPESSNLGILNPESLNT